MAIVGRLDDTFVSIINDIMLTERRPMDQLQAERDTISKVSTAYSDMNSKLSALQKSIQALKSTDPFFALKPGRKSSVLNAPKETAVISASLSTWALPGTYDVAVTTLARAERFSSADQASTDQALNKMGTIWLGGTGAASAAGSGGAVASVTDSAITSGLRELGTGSTATGNAYLIETRQNGSNWEFRLKNADGNVVAIDDKSKSDNSLTSSWQSFTADEVYDTGRGLKITFGGAPSAASTAIDYTARGVSVSVAASDTLVNIATKINDALQPDGRDLKATVVGKQLVFTAVNSGTNHKMVYSFAGGLDLGIFTERQAASNAVFKVNNIDFTRQSNTNLTDVISGITFNLENDAVDSVGAGRSASLKVEPDMSGPRQTVDDFVAKFNEAIDYIALKSMVEKGTDEQYVRGVLANDTVFGELRSNLLSRSMQIYNVSGKFKALREIGLTLDDNLKLVVSDSTRLDSALSGSLEDVKGLLDKVMGGMDTTLGRFTGTTTANGYIESALSGFNRQLSAIDTSIKDMDVHLLERQQFLVNQYGELQAQLMSMTYTSQMFSSIYGGYSRTM